jgi:hypothetical protein
MKYILFETRTGRICIGRTEEDNDFKDNVTIKDVMSLGAAPVENGWGLKFRAYFFPYANELEEFKFGSIYKWRFANEILEGEYIKTLTGIVTNVNKKIIT